MNRPAAVMSDRNLAWNTQISRGAQARIFKYADDLKTDPRKDERVARSQCVVCFYSPARMAGAAITVRPCMSCHKDQRFSSTNTDVLCTPCGTAHGLCTHCGADVNLQERSVWPKAYANDDPK